MASLLVVHHTPAIQAMFEAAMDGNSDTTGAVEAVESIATGLDWRRSRPPVWVTGEPAGAGLGSCWELAATLAAGQAETAGP